MKKNMFCFIMVIMIAFSGMYFTDVETRSMLSCADSGEAIHSFVSPKSFPREEICAEEFSGLGFVSDVVEESERTGERDSEKETIILIVLAVLLAGSKYFMVIKRLRTYYSVDSRGVIIRYIHHQDGRKG